MLETGSKKLYTYRLSIRVAADGFSLSTYRDGKILQREDTELEAGADLYALLRHALTRPRIMDLRFEEVWLLADTETTLLPLDEFRTSDAVAVFRLNFPNANFAATELRHEILAPQEVVMLYGLSTRTEQVVRQSYPNVQLRSLQGSLIEASAQQVGRGEAKRLFAYIGPQRMTVCLFARSKFLFSGSYTAATDSDRVYYLLAAWRSLNLDVQRDELILSGASESLSEMLGRYISHLSETKE